MIIASYNAVFIHVPKTAGKSVEQFFLNLLGSSWEQRATFLLRENADPLLGPERLAHLTATEYVECNYLSQAQFDRAYKFTFVRNPWARLVSEYRYRNYSHRFSFRDFVLGGLPQPGMSDTYRHIIPQYDFIYDSDGQKLVNFVGRFESLQGDFDKVCAELKILSGKLPYMDFTKGRMGRIKKNLQKIISRNYEPFHDSYKDYYDAETLEIVSSMYEKDIDLFGYTFDE